MLAQGFSLNQFNRRNFLIWCSLAFQAGSINAGGFLACHRFVSHITGFSTHFGVEMAHGNWHDAWGILTVPLFFVLGAMTSALFIDRRISMHRRPQYTQVIFVIGLIMLLVTFLGTRGHFSPFGSPVMLTLDYELLALLCLACGMQNAAVTSASGAIIRTTHMTGLTTDLSIGLVRLFSRHLPSEALAMEQRKTLIRLGLISSFILGSVTGALLFYRVEYWGFLLPAGLSLLLTGLALFYRRKVQPSSEVRLG